MFLFLHKKINLFLKFSEKFRTISLILTIYIISSIFFCFYMIIIEKLTLIDSIYYLITTSTTVGYGDISPTTNIGKILSIIYMIISISTLGLLIGFFGEKMIEFSEKNKKGLIKMKKEVKLLIIGYPSEDKVKELVLELRKDENFENEKIVCISNDLDEKPLWFNSHNTTFIKGIGSNIETLQKAGIYHTKNVLILANNPNDIISDDISSSTATVIKQIMPNLRIIIERVRQETILFEALHCDVITRITSPEILAQEILDPGAIELQETIFSNETEGTQFNYIYNGKDINWIDIAIELLNEEVIPEGFKNSNNKNFNLFPKKSDIVLNGAIIKYRGLKRKKEYLKC